MIAAQQQDILRNLLHPAEHFIVLTSTVNIISRQDQLILIRKADLCKHRVQLVKTAVQIAHDIGISSFRFACFGGQLFAWCLFF